jgi:hypothetical protein
MKPVAGTLTRVMTATLRDAPRKAFLIRMSQVSTNIWDLASHRIWDRIPATGIAFDLVLHLDSDDDGEGLEL